MKKNTLILALIALTALALGSCGHRNDYTPKPNAYIRFDLPDKAYSLYDTTALPFLFERADEADIVWQKDARGEKWIDVIYPSYRGVMFITYKPLHSEKDLPAQIDTSYELLKQHFNFSSGVDEEQFYNPSRHVFATTYQLKGGDVASTYQFWATDSTRHFLRGSLYLDCTPNNDSLAPIIDYLQQDIVHLLETLQWRDRANTAKQ